MNSEDFAKVFDQQMRLCSEVLFAKAGEYATDDERLHNFKVASALTGRDAVQALGGMMVKHTTSVYDMIEHGAPANFSMEKWDEKITDHINYLILLRACVIEAMNEDQALRHPALFERADVLPCASPTDYSGHTPA